MSGWPHRLLAVAAVAWLAGCPRVGGMKPGTRIPTAELYARRADLDALVLREIGAGHHARAFYALEVLKTRRYAVPQLANRAGGAGARVDPQHRDLRPLLAALSDPAGATDHPARKLVLRTGGRGALQPYRAESDRAFWQDLALAEARLQAQVPYGHVLRGHQAIASVEEAQLLFARDEAFLSLFVAGEATYGLLLVGGRLHVRRLPAATAVLRRELEVLLALVRRPAADDGPWSRASRALAADLLGPFQRELAAARALYVSPDGFLANVPWAALFEPGQDRLLIERVRVSLLLSASQYRSLLQRPILNDPPRLLAVGNPVYPPGVVSLPLADREADAVSDLFARTLLLRGEAATEARVAAAASDHNILHFATHGVLLGRALPGASSLMVTAGGEDDGFLNAAEIATLDLSRTYLAVLSACETSVGDDADAVVELGSLTGAFLSAGAPSVIGTLWQISDAATTRLMLTFYERFLEAGAGDALRAAQLALRSQPGYRHPYYWAAFALYGWDK